MHACALHEKNMVKFLYKTQVPNKVPLFADTDTEDGGDDKNLDIQTIVDKITQFKGLLKLANERADKPVDVNGKLADFMTNYSKV